MKSAVVRSLDEIRRSDVPVDVAPETLAARIATTVELESRPSLRRVVNGTGVIIHTNLGRSPVAAAVWQRAEELTARYSNLEFDLESAGRGKRDSHLRELANEIFGCDDAILVNNNASAVLLVLAASAPGKEVIVSRGELVEIGGAFRVPDVIVQGGARLREVGTTNRTRASDYESAIGESTGALLKVHRSNFEIVGFTEEAALGDLVSVSRSGSVPLVIDEGSGRIVDLARWGFGAKATVREMLEAGADVVTCSTDKLIGGLQGGLILGRSDLVRRCAKHPLMRALRAGKESYAVNAATLELFATGRETEIPIYAMLERSLAELEASAKAIAEATGGEVVATRSVLGGGTTPTESIESRGVRWSGGSAAERHSTLLRNDPPIVAVVQEDAVVLDVRTLFEGDDAIVIAACKR